MEAEMTQVQLACFNLNDKLFAVDIMRIREILVPQKLSPLPRASDLLEGVINLRGSVIPVMNMRKRFGMSLVDESVLPGKLLIVSLAGQLLALVVDDVMEVISVQASEIKPPIQVATGVEMEFLLGVCLSNNRVFMVLDVDSLLCTQNRFQSSLTA